MCLSSDIARENTERPLGLLLEQHGPVYKNRAGRCVTVSRRSKKTTCHRVTDQEKFAL
jgi:hypothetical protein